MACPQPPAAPQSSSALGRCRTLGRAVRAICVPAVLVTDAVDNPVTTLTHARLVAAGFKTVSVAPPTPQSDVTIGTRAAA
jgi:hypothetical protein